MGNSASDASNAGSATAAGGSDDGRSGAGALNEEDREWLRVALHDLHDDRLVTALLARLPAAAPSTPSADNSTSSSFSGHRLTLSTSNNDPSVLYSSSAAGDSNSSPPSTPPSAGARRRLTREQSQALYYQAEEPPLPAPSTRPSSELGGGHHSSDAGKETNARMLQALAELLGREPWQRPTAEQASVLRCPELGLGAAEAEAEAEAITEGLKARVRIFQRIQRAVRNELVHTGRNGLRRSQSDPHGLSSMAGADAGPSAAAEVGDQQHAEPEAAPGPGNVMMAAAIQMVLTMATQPQTDTQAAASLCDALVGLLQECPPEALAALDDADDEDGEGEQSQAPHDRSLEAESFGRIARFAHDMAESDAPGQQRHALSLLVALGVATGSVAALVDAAHRLLLEPDDKEQLLPAVASFLGRLAGEAGSSEPPAACNDSEGSSFVATSAMALALLATNKEQVMTMRKAGLFILAHLDRLAAPFDAPPSAPDAEGHAEADSSVGTGTSSSSTNTEGPSPYGDQQQHEQQRRRRRHFRYDLRPLTFRRLLALVRTHLPYVPSSTPNTDAPTTSGNVWGPYALLAGLRLLRVNVHQLARHHAARGVRLGPRALRLELLELVMALLDATAHDGEHPEGADDGLRAALQREALALFVAGVEVFYPDGDAQARLLALHLRHHRASAATPAAAAIRSLLLARLRDLPAMADLVEGVTAALHQRQSAQGGGGAGKKAAVVTPPLPLYPAARHRRGTESRGSVSSLGSLGSSLSLSTGSSTSHSCTSSPLADLVGVLMHLSAGASIWALRGQEGQSAASTIVVDDASAILDTMLLYLVGRAEEKDDEGEVDMGIGGAGGTMALFLAALVPEAQAMLQAAATASTDPATLNADLRRSLVGRLLAPCLTFLWGQATALSVSSRTHRLLLDLAPSLVPLLRSLSQVLARLASSADEEDGHQWLRQLEQVVAMLGGLAVEAQLRPEAGGPEEERRHARWLEEGEDGDNNALLATLPAPELLGALLPHLGAAGDFPAMVLSPSGSTAAVTSPWSTATAIATPPRPSRKTLVAPRSRPRSLELELLHLPQASGPRTPTAALRQTAKMPGCASPVAVRDPGLLLRQLARSPPGPLAQSLFKLMQSHVPEARAALQGSPCVGAAIHAAAAALILHNNLAAEAMDLVIGKRPAPSPALTKAWRQAHRMRQWLLVVKHAGAEDNEDMEEDGLAQACADAVHRARWLLAIQPFDEARLQAQLAEEGGNDDDPINLSASSSLTPRRRLGRRRSHPARGRGCASIDMSDTWSAALAASGTSDGGGSPASSATAAITDAAQALRDLLECRRALAAHRGCTASDTATAATAAAAAQPAASTSEQVLSFLQSDTRVEDLAAVMRSRDALARDRAEALRLARALLGAIASPEAKAAALRTITCGLRALADGDSASSRVHCLGGLGGAGDEAKAAVRGAFFDLLGEAVGLLQPSSTEQLQLAGLRLCALDYGPEDHALLHDCRILPQLQRLMAPPHPLQVRCAARACFKLLLHRCLCRDEGALGAAAPSPATPIPTLVQHALLNVVKDEVEAIGQLASSTSRERSPAAAPATAGCLLGSDRPLPLSPSMVGLQFPASAAPLTAKDNTLAFWLWRPERPAELSRARAVYRVVGAEGCLVRATPDLDSPVVTTLDTDTLVEVEDPVTSFASHPLVLSGRRVHIVAPVRGFGSKFAAMGYTILREEVSLRPGDRVCRGPDWQDMAGDEVQEEAHGAGLGTVLALTDWETAERRGVVVRWDHEPEGAARTYRYGFMGKYDVVRTARDESGLLLYKGNEALLSSEEAQGTWTYMGVALTDSGAVEHLIDAGDKCIRVAGQRVVPVERWTHVAVVHSDDAVRIFYDGQPVCDAPTPLPLHLRRPCRPRFRAIMQRIESPHPYPNNMNESWTVSIPGASMIRVTFDARTKSEPEFDYLAIYRDESRTETWGAAKYSGGRAGSTSNWPGIGGPPLDVPASRFIVHFTSDGSNNDWGFALVAEALVPVYGEEAERGFDSKPAELNLYPWYLGQPPAHVTSRRTTPHGYLAGVHALPTALDADGLQALMHATTPSSATPSAPFPEPRAVDTLAMLRRCLASAVGRAAFPTGAAAGFLLDCLLLPPEVDSYRSVVPVATRLAALHLAETVLPMLPPAQLDARIGSAEGSIVPALLRGAGRVFNVWGDYLLAHNGKSRRNGSGLGASATAALALAQLAVLRSTANASDAWADKVAAAVVTSLGAASALVAALSGPADAKLDVDTAALDGLLAALCLLGGEFGAPRVGAQVSYAVPQQPAANATSASSSTMDMECGRGVVLKVDLPSAASKEVGNEGGEQRECVFTILPDGDASKAPIQAPATGVSCLPSAVPNALVQRLVDEAPSLLPAFGALVAPGLSSPPASVGASLAMAALGDLQARAAKALTVLYAHEAFATAYQPLLPALATLALAPVQAATSVEAIQRTRLLESQHPYRNNTRETIEVRFPGATKLSVAFDEQSRTETGCDVLVFFADHSRQRRWGRDKYSGRDQWPGCRGCPPLEIPAAGFILSWTTDATNTDWGWRMTVTATLPGLEPRTAPFPLLEQRLYHVTELLQEGPAHLLRHQPPLKTADAAAAKPVDVAPWPPTSMVEQQEGKKMEQGDLDATTSSATDGNFACHDAVLTSSTRSLVGGYDPRHDLKGQTGQALWGFAVSSYQAAGVRFASSGLLAHLRRWPAERLSLPTLAGLFGSMDGLWRFLSAAHALEGVHGLAASDGAASCRDLLGKGGIAQGLLQRAVAVLGGNDLEEEQDVDLACWVLEQRATQARGEPNDGDLGTVLHANSTFLAIRDRLLLATTSPTLRMRLLGLASLLVRQLPRPKAYTVVDGLNSLGQALQRLLEAQHAKEEDRAAKSPYLQALVQSLVSLASVLDNDQGMGQGPGPWFGDVCAAMEMLTEMSKGQLPLQLLAGEFLSRVRAEQGVVIQSAHPFNQASERRSVRIPGAPALEVAVDEATQMGEQDEIVVHSSGADTPIRLVGPGAHAVPGRRVVVPGDVLEVEVMTGPTGAGGKSQSASFPGSLKFSSITHSHAVIPPYPALDLDNDFSIELWLRLAPGAARNGRGKCAWSVVLTEAEMEEQQEQRRCQQEQQQHNDEEASSASPTSLSPPSSWRQRQWQRRRQQQSERVFEHQQGVPRTVRRAISFSDATGSQDDDLDGADEGANTEGGRWSTEGPLTTGDALAREGSILSRASVARRAALPSFQPSVARAVDGAALEQLQQMGFSLDVARRSLEVARNDVRQAVEYCTNGIPNERLFIARGAEALRLMARRAALAEGSAEAAATTPSSVSSTSSSTTSPAASSFSSASPSGGSRNRLSHLHAYLSRLSSARGPLSPLPTDAIAGLLRPTAASPSSTGSSGGSGPPRRAVSDTNVALGLRVVRGRHWHYEDQDGSGQGTVVGFIRLDRTRAAASTVDDGTTTAVDNPMLPGWVRVRWDATGTANSYEAGARGLYALSLASVIPGPPQQLRAKADAAAGVRLRWQPPSDTGAPAMTTYRIYRDGDLIHTTSNATECTFQDEEAVAGATHTYAVAGISTLGEGERSEALELYVAYAQDRRALLKLGVTGEGQLQFLYGVAQLLPSSGGEGIVALNGGGLEEERWTHVAVTFEQSSGQLRLFVDGAQRDARALPGPLCAARLKQSLARGKPIYLGALGPDDDHWEGHLHDARFWSAPRPARALRQHAARLATHAHDFLQGGGSSLDPSSAPATYDVVNRGPQRFPSLRIDCPVPPRTRVYYEATLRSGGCLQIGWAGPRYAPAAAYMGIGDDTHSWACDGLRQMKWHGVADRPNSPSPDGPQEQQRQQQQQQFGHGVPYGGPQSWLWKAGDTIGCLLDADAGVMRFTHNGRDLGLAFTRQQRCAGRYRIEGLDSVSCYVMPRAEPGDRLPLRLPPGMVVHATQAEEGPSGDGSVWLRVRQGWIQQQQREEGGIVPSSKIVRLSHRRVAPPDGWYAGTPERCLLLRRFAPDAWMPREAAALPPVGMIITEHGLERRGGDSGDEDEDDGVRDGRAVLAPGIEVDGAAVDVVTFLLMIDSYHRRPRSQGDAEGDEEEDEDLDDCAGLVLGDCELLAFPKAVPPLLEIREGGRLLAEAAMPITQTTPAPSAAAAPARFHLSARLRKADGHVAVRLTREGVEGQAAASAEASLPSFFEGHELGPVGVVLRPTEPLLGFRGEEEEDGDGQDSRRPTLAIRSLATFASDVESPLDDNELRALEPRMRTLQAARASEPVWGSDEAVDDDEGDKKEAAAWEGLMPAMSCSEDEGLAFNLGHQPFCYPPPAGYQSLAAAALEAAGRAPTVAPPTLALQVYDPERGVWETVHSARRGHRLLRAVPRPEGEEAEEAEDGEEREARLMARFLLAEGRGYTAANAVATYSGPLTDSDAALPFPAAALHGTLWDVDARSPAAEGGPLWGWRLTITPSFSPGAALPPGLRLALVDAAADAAGTVAEPAPAGGPLDAQLVRYVNVAACKRGLGASALLSADWAALVPEHRELVAWPLLAQAMTGAGHRSSTTAPKVQQQQKGWEEAKDSRESRTRATSIASANDDDVLASMCLLPAARSVADLNQTVATRARKVEDDDLDGSASESARRREWAGLGGAGGQGPTLLPADPSKGLPRRLALGAEGDCAAGPSSSSSSAGPCALVVSVVDHPDQKGEPLCISGVWTIGANPTDLLGVVVRTTGHCWGSGPLALGLADGLACCLRPVDGSLHLLAPPFVPGRERYPIGLGPEQCVAYLGAEEVAPGTRVAFQVTDDGARVTFAATVLGALEKDSTPLHSARLALRCPAAQHGSGSSRVAFVRLAEEASEEEQGWVRIVCTDPRGATLRDGVSIDTGEPVGRLPQGAVARYTARVIYESPDEMQDVCEPVVRFRLEGTPTRPGGWVSERGRYGRNPYPIAERLVFPRSSSSSAAPTLAHLRIGTGEDAAITTVDDDLKPQCLAPRFRMLRAFNTAILAALPYVDLARAAAPAAGRSDDSSIAVLVASSRHLLFSELKMGLWDAALEATATPLDTLAASPRDLQLSRPLAARHRASGEPDTEARHSLWGQAFQQLRALPGAAFRLRTGQALYHTVLAGEMAHDAGGPYRETLATFCEELQSGALPLLLRCPNAVHNAGRNRDKWLPHPAATGLLALEQFAFLGRLMGLAARTRQYLELGFPSLVWKQLVGQPLAREDLEGVDTLLVRGMDSLRAIEAQGITADVFQEVIYETFTTLTTDDRTVELKPGGASIHVTFHTRFEFADLVEAYRLNEFSVQVQAIRTGLTQVLPARLLPLLTWEELEALVCGSPEVDVDLLEECTEYNACSPEQAHVKWFWAVLREDFTPAERALFVRFVFGRSRLPLRAEQFRQRFKLQAFHRPPPPQTQDQDGPTEGIPDTYLPVAHTCFFSLELPEYSSQQVCAERLRYAIHHCVAIDADETALGRRAASLGWDG